MITNSTYLYDKHHTTKGGLVDMDRLLDEGTGYSDIFKNEKTLLRDYLPNNGRYVLFLIVTSTGQTSTL